MSRSGMLAAFLATVALAACGGSDGVRTDEIDGVDDVDEVDEVEEIGWTLTILSPRDGGLAPDETAVVVEVGGEGVDRQKERTFEIGVFVDGALAARSDGIEIPVELAPGSRVIAVEGIDAQGEILPNVVGDQVEVRVLDLEQPNLDQLGIPSRLRDEAFNKDEALPVGNQQNPRDRRQPGDEFERRLP